jgi:hypothetical protein
VLKPRRHRGQYATPSGWGALEEKPKLRFANSYPIAVLELVTINADRIHEDTVLAAAVVDDHLAVFVL